MQTVCNSVIKYSLCGLALTFPVQATHTARMYSGLNTLVTPNLAHLIPEKCYVALTSLHIHIFNVFNSLQHMNT